MTFFINIKVNTLRRIRMYGLCCSSSKSTTIS